MARDNFTAKIVEKVAKRAGYRCSMCGRDTVGPSTKNGSGHDHIGVASHITAAAPGGPRFNSKL